MNKVQHFFRPSDNKEICKCGKLEFSENHLMYPNYQYQKDANII